jgi:hypothetical protein
MKKIIVLFVFILAYNLYPNLYAFTGVVSFETENFEAGEKSGITCYIKSPYCKMEIQSTTKEGNASYTLYFNDGNADLIMVSGGTRLVVPMTNVPVNKYLENILVALPTAKSQMVAGYTTQEVNLKTTNSTIQCWVAAEVNIQFPLMLNNRGILYALKENSIVGTPLEIHAKDLSGKPVFSQKIISIQPQELSDAIFMAE